MGQPGSYIIRAGGPAVEQAAWLNHRIPSLITPPASDWAGVGPPPREEPARAPPHRVLPLYWRRIWARSAGYWRRTARLYGATTPTSRTGRRSMRCAGAVGKKEPPDWCPPEGRERPRGAMRALPGGRGLAVAE